MASEEGGWEQIEVRQVREAGVGLTVCSLNTALLLRADFARHLCENCWKVPETKAQNEGHDPQEPVSGDETSSHGGPRREETHDCNAVADAAAHTRDLAGHDRSNQCGKQQKCLAVCLFRRSHFELPLGLRIEQQIKVK